MPEILQSVGQRSKELVTNLARFTALEESEQHQIHKNGGLTRLVHYKGKYLVFISEVRKGMIQVDESRNAQGNPDIPGTDIYDDGLAALALLFHPYYVDDFSIACEGLSDWHGQPTWQVHFSQRPDRPARMHEFVVGERHFQLKLKGRAWITADRFQVAHLDVDLAVPVPEIRLFANRITIDYRPVHFAQRELDLWLPESVGSYMDFRGHQLWFTHHFSDFLLFSVDTLQDIQSPRQPQ